MATVMQKIKDIEDEMARTQKNKATAHHLGLLKAKLAKLRREDLEPSTKGAGGVGEGFDVTKSGDARVGLVGVPSVGKSTLLNKLTGTFSEVENPPFCLQYILRWGLPDPIMGKWKGTSEMVLVDFRSLLIFSAFLRVALIVYGEWQDAHMDIRYTDIDYLVFSDAALLMASGESPYKRTTYRYSPLLAFLMIPNSIVHHSWGKFIFSASDLLVGVFIRTILNLRKVPENLCTYSVVVWLFNPFTFTIGTRGNCEPIVCAIILWVVICLMKGNFLQASFWYGLVVHFRIYPIIYALPLVLVLDPDCFRYGRKPIIGNWISFQVKASDTGSAIKCNWCYALRSIFSNERILFGLISATVFFFFTGLFFYLYEWEFLHEALLYHLTRTDPRHNFSIYFYHIYLQFENTISVIEKLVAFFPQFLVQSVLIFCFARDLLFCMFVQTVAFVAFNKVITAQYFVWFFCLFPVILPWCKMRLKWKGLCCIAVWIGAQLHWLLWGYLLEFKGMNVFLQLWVAGLVFLAANTSVLLMIIRDHRYSPIFKSLDKKSS